MASVKSGKYFGLFFVVALVLLNVAFIFYTFFLISRSAEYRLKFSVDERRVTAILNEAVSNYLSRTSFQSSSRDEVQLPKSPKVLFVKGCTWLHPRGFYACRIGDVDYVAGDYCQFGEIILISDGRFYCKSEDGVVIIVRLVNDNIDDAGDSARLRAEPPALDLSESL